MKTFLSKLIRGITALLLLWVGHPKAKGAEAGINMRHSPKLAKKEMTAMLKTRTGIYYPGSRRDAKLLHKRLADYQRSVWKGNFPEKEEALKRLQKQWRKTERNQLRSLKVIYKDTSLSAKDPADRWS